MVKKWWSTVHNTDPGSLPARVRASSRGKGPDAEPPPWLEASWSSFQPISINSPDDWLAKGNAGERDRPGQTLAQFLRPGPHRNFPSKHRRTIYLVPVGDVSAAPPFEVLAQCVSAHFCLPVKRGKPVQGKDLKRIQVSSEGQFEAPSATELLFGARREADAFVSVGYTMTDICDTEKGFGFLFGQACLDRAVGIFSFARYFEDTTGPEVFLRRCCMVLCHEIGHLFGIKHCVWATCLMNGSNHLAESEARPFALCPCDLLKLEDAHRSVGGLDLAERARRLLHFCETHGFDQDAALAAAHLQLLAGTCAECAPAPPSTASTGLDEDGDLDD